VGILTFDSTKKIPAQAKLGRGMEQIVTLYESKQRDPLDVLKKKYVEFIRACPS